MIHVDAISKRTSIKTIKKVNAVAKEKCKKNVE